jgi:hypothetical protein
VGVASLARGSNPVPVPRLDAIGYNYNSKVAVGKCVMVNILKVMLNSAICFS